MIDKESINKRWGHLFKISLFTVVGVALDTLFDFNLPPEIFCVSIPGALIAGRIGWKITNSKPLEIKDTDPLGREGVKTAINEIKTPGNLDIILYAASGLLLSPTVTGFIENYGQETLDLFSRLTN